MQFENITTEYGVKGKGQPHDLDPMSRRSLDKMYRKIMSVTSRFINNDTDYKNWSYCVMDDVPFYFAVNEIKKIRPSDKNNPEGTFTAIMITMTRVVDHSGWSTQPNVPQTSHIKISLSEVGQQRFETFLSAMQAVIDAQKQGVTDPNSPTILNYVFRLDDRQMKNIARRESLNCSKKKSLQLTENEFYSVIEEAVKKIVNELL